MKLRLNIRIVLSLLAGAIAVPALAQLPSPIVDQDKQRANMGVANFVKRMYAEHR